MSTIAAKTFAATAAVIGALAIATTQAAAEPADRTPSDTTGWHHIDRFGFHHTDLDPRMEAEHRDNQREYYRHLNAPETSIGTATSGSSGSQTWTAAARPDGNGWVVCKPHARQCG
ncbi:hypothetical protein [Nocardia sp. NPDC050793]|uniref:hypothetical protein n=1 Tax=Nocardia sp. NPDC050793 TaxID=3155159 RepID=UPI0033C0287C